MTARYAQKAQTAIELAVFGSILIFVLGTIVSAGLSRGNQQNSVLKANRLALTLSYNASASLDEASRNFSSVLIVEDRLTAASAKYGAIDRSPNIAQASGSHSANLFMPIEFGDDEDLPMMDVFVNGEHYTFTTAAFKTIKIYPELSGSCPIGYEEDTGSGGGSGPPGCVARPTWEPNCIAKSSGGVITYEGCPKLYTIIDNNPLIDRWCDGGSVPCPPTCTTPPVLGCNLAPAERFLLDSEKGISVPSGEWERFSWQWFLVMGYDEGIDGSATIDQLYMDPNNPGPIVTEGLALAEGIDIAAGKNVLADFDRDLKLEVITQRHSSGEPEGGIILYTNPETGETNGSIYAVEVRDNQEGDMDLTYNSSDGGPRPGFTRDVTIYTFVRDSGAQGGTFLRIESDGLYSGSSFVRTTSMKDTIDMIERKFQLSNNTGRFCGNSTIETIGGVDIENPVKSCGSCFSPENIGQSCLDTRSNIIYMRSNIADIRGRQWTTDTSGDPYVQIETPRGN